MQKLHSYIAEGEHQQQDFKFRVDDAKKIARTLVAFANTDGGRLLIGVKDNGKVTGINPEEEFHIIKGASDMFCKPAVEFSSQIWQDDHKLVLEIIVPQSAKKPHKAKDDNDKWKTYVRRADHTLLANKILVGVWKAQKQKINKPQEFTEDEAFLLETIRNLQPVTLSKLYRRTKLKKSLIDSLLIRFIAWDVIEMVITPEGTFYKVPDENKA